MSYIYYNINCIIYYYNVIILYLTVIGNNVIAMFSYDCNIFYE